MGSLRIALCWCGLAALVPLGAVSSGLSDGFADPPRENRPVVWWWWNDDMSHVPRAAITRDLEGLKRVGISGFHIYGGSVTGKGWTEKAKWAFHEANRLGLDGYVMIGAAGCGHRATPHRFAPKDIVFTTVRAEGGRDIRITLPKKGVKETPKNPDGSPELYMDIITLAAPGVPGGADFPLDDVVNVSGYLDSGTDEFMWPNAPTGTWTIVRCASVPKVFGWMGCYIDHLSREAMDFHWNHVMKPLLAALAPDERKALKGVLCDSWETGTMSWTEEFPEEFRRLHGYSVYPWLVHKAGLGPGDRASRAKFRRDWDETISTLIAENHYAYKRELAHREGLISIAEACGPHQRQGDVRRMQGRCDVAMGEFWMPCNHRPEDTQRFMVRDAATAAHVYGMKEVLAEAFTTIDTYWIESPRTLKPCADRAFCDGLTRVCYHGMKLSGSLTDRPGAIRNVGTHYNPQTTWFEQSKAFNLYLSRCSWMLSQGRFVADALVYAGDAINVFAGMKDVRDALGPGFDYDFCPTELLVQAKVEDGEIVLPSGMRYKALVISDKNPAAKRMAPGKLPPVTTAPPPSVSHFIPAEARTAIDRIGKGGVPVLQTRNERQAWSAKRTPDFRADGLRDVSSVDWIHRTGDFGDLYFLANRTEARQVFTAKLRTVADAVELWDPVTGERKRAIADRAEDGITAVKVDLPAFGSVFVVFPKEATAASSRTPNPALAKSLPGPWTVTFDPKVGGPAGPVVFDELTDWTERSEAEIRHYSGTAEYRTTVAFDPLTMRKGSRAVLDLGKVREVAEVRVNGRDCGTVWTAPYRVDITDAVSTNLEIAIRVTNLWPNRLIGDAALPAAERIARTNLNKYKAEDPLLPSGLLGPVTVRMESEGVRTLVVNGREWVLGSEVAVSGTCVTVKADGVRKRSASVTTKVDLAPYLEDGLEWRVRAKGRGLAKPAQNWLGVKAMLSYEDGNGKRQYPGPITKSGDFDWYMIRYRTAFKNGVKGLGTFTLGLQETSGEVCFDLATFRLGPAKVSFPTNDPAARCEYSPEMKARPRLRGVMSPSRLMTEDDFRKLQSWGVTLLRYQMNRFWNLQDANRDLDDYDRWLNGKLDHLEKTVLPLAEKYGIKVLVDLHMPPGGKAWDGEMNLFHEREYARHFVACWLRIARRFKENPTICGYDLINEPVQNYNAVGSLDYWTLQAKTAERIRAIDPTTPIYLESNHADSPKGFTELPVLGLRDVVYQVHLYEPMEFTHQGVHRGRPSVPAKWPDETKGWNRDFLRKKLEPVRAFEKRHGARIYVGEFSAIAWAEGAERYLEDCIAVFEEYGWDWSYHAYGEFEGWSVEHAANTPWKFRPAASTPRKEVLLKGLAKADERRCETLPLHLETTAPVLLDFGSDGTAGYPEIEAKPVRGQPKVRLSYGCYPAFGRNGDFWRETSARYLGKDFDLPILPANINRFDVFTVTNAGTYSSPLQQGLQRYVRVQLEEPDAIVDISSVRFVNRGTHSEEPVVGSFSCSDERLTALWKASVRTCQLAAIPARTEPLHIVTPETNVVLGTTYAYLSDGAKRDRLVWSGDLWWAQYNMYAAFASDSPYLPGSLRMLAENQTPEGYVQACPYPESHGPLADGDYGPFPSDEFAAWFVPVLAAHYLHTGDRGLVEELYPNVRNLLDYLSRHTRDDFIFEQRPETSKHANGLAFGASSVHHRSFINVLLWRTFRDAATLADVCGKAKDAADWRVRARRYADATRERFFLPTGLLRTSLEDANPGLEATALALGTEFFTPDEAKRAFAALPRVGHGKFQLLVVRGAFAYGLPDEALRRIAEHDWLKMVDPAYKGIHTTTECMQFRTKCSWGDEAHPDTALAGDLTAGILGIRPLEPGYARFAFEPNPPAGIDWAFGVVPTPKGPIKASWRRVNGKIEKKVLAPDGECPIESGSSGRDGASCAGMTAAYGIMPE